MTIEEIKACDKDFLNAEDLRGLIPADPHNIRQQAQADALKLGFHVCVLGNRVLIPRVAFLEWMGFEVKR